MEKFVMPMDYYYKGSINSTVTLQENNDGTISVITGYGETVRTCSSGHEVAEVLAALDFGRFL